MGKKLVMHQDNTYTTSAVYGFDWVEDAVAPKAGTFKIKALKRCVRKNRAKGWSLLPGMFRSLRRIIFT